MGGTGLADLVAQAYEAACDAKGIATFIADTANYFSANQGAVVIWPLNNPDALLAITHGLSVDTVREWFNQRDLPGSLFDQFSELSQGGALNHQHDAAGQIAPLTEPAHIMGGVAVSDHQSRCVMLLMRDGQLLPFSTPDQETLQTLMGYFRRATAINKRFVNIFHEHKSAVSVLDRAPRAVIILGHDGLPNYQNMEATKICRSNDGFTLGENGLLIDDADTQEKIINFIEQIRISDPEKLSPHRLITIIPRKSGHAPYKLIMYSLYTDNLPALSNDKHGLAVLLINDPDTSFDINKNLLHSFYGLSKAEANLAHSLFMGKTLHEAAEELGVSINTIRTQLRSIFTKVGVHSQSALMQEFARSVMQA